MAERINQACSHVPRKPEMRVIAAIHCVAVIVVAALFVTQHLVRYWNQVHLLAWQLESLCWIVPICLLLAVSYGLWNQLAWARSLTLILHWPICVGALGMTVLFAGTIIIYVPESGFDLSTALMATSLLVLVPIVLASASTLWGLHRGFGAMNAGTAIFIIILVVSAEGVALWYVCTRLFHIGLHEVGANLLGM